MDKTQIEDLIENIKYKVTNNNWFLSRCIDGRYDKENLEPLAKPGADIGDLMTLFAVNRQYNLGLKNQDIFNALIKTVENYQNLRFHTDLHNENNFLGCGHFKQAKLNPKAYYLTYKNISAINQFLLEAVKQGAVITILSGEHNESSVLIIKGDGWSVKPQYKKNNIISESFVHHKSLDNKRRRKLAENLLPFIKLGIKLDVDYLYQILTKTADFQLLETVSRLASSLPAFEVNFAPNGSFEVKLK